MNGVRSSTPIVIPGLIRAVSSLPMAELTVSLLADPSPMIQPRFIPTPRPRTWGVEVTAFVQRSQVMMGTTRLNLRRLLGSRSLPPNYLRRVLSLTRSHPCLGQASGMSLDRLDSLASWSSDAVPHRRSAPRRSGGQWAGQ